MQRVISVDHKSLEKYKMLNCVVIKIAKPIAVVCNAISIIIGIVLTAIGAWISTSLKKVIHGTVDTVDRETELDLEPAKDAYDGVVNPLANTLIFLGVWMILTSILGCFVTLGQKPK